MKNSDCDWAFFGFNSCSGLGGWTSHESSSFGCIDIVSCHWDNDIWESNSCEPMVLTAIKFRSEHLLGTLPASALSGLVELPDFGSSGVLDWILIGLWWLGCFFHSNPLVNFYEIQNGWFRNSMGVFVRFNFFSHTIEACPVTSGCLCQRDVAPFRANLSNDLDEEMGNRQRRFCIWHGKPMRCAGDLWWNRLRVGRVPKIDELVDQLGYTSSDSIILLKWT